jgi:tetratricopeptide (TPR) repeat protein
MTQLFAKKSNDYFVNYRLGWLFSLNQKYKNATEHYTKAADINPDSLEPWLALSLLYLNLGEWDKSMSYSLEVINRNKDSYYGHLRYITAAIQAKKCNIAIDKILYILKSYPTDVVFLEQKAFCYESLSKIDEAKKAVVELKLLSPQNFYANSFMKKYK